MVDELAWQAYDTAMQTHNRYRFRALVLALPLVLLGACSDAEPEERTPEPISSAAPVPVEGPDETPDPPSTPDYPPGICDAVKTWCPTPDYWPRDEVLGSYPGVTQFCFCRCDPNLGSPGPSCSLSPLPSDCGTLMEQITNPDGSIGFKTKFHQGYPNLCRYSMTVPAQ
jgi:hypothetical protein